MRFYLKYHYPEATERPWVAISGAKIVMKNEETKAWMKGRLDAKLTESDNQYFLPKRDLLPKTVLRSLYYSTEEYKDYLSSGVMND